MSIDRRALLQALAVLAATPWNASAQAALTPEQFTRLSAALTATPALDAAAAAQLQAAFATPERTAQLARLAELALATPPANLDAAIRAQGLDRIANDLTSAWTSGIVTSGKGAAVVLYTDALLWQAM